MYFCNYLFIATHNLNKAKMKVVNVIQNNVFSANFRNFKINLLQKQQIFHQLILLKFVKL